VKPAKTSAVLRAKMDEFGVHNLTFHSPHPQSLFRSAFLVDKSPVIVLKDVDFENLKALVEYMYKGEANVPQNMLTSFIRTAESLQIRGLAEGATGSKCFDSQNPTPIRTTPVAGSPIFPGHQSTPVNSRRGNNNVSAVSGGNNGGILAARLAAAAAAGAASAPTSLFDFNPAAAAAAAANGVMLPRHPPPAMMPSHLPPTKKSRKSERPQQLGAGNSPTDKDAVTTPTRFTSLFISRITFNQLYELHFRHKTRSSPTKSPSSTSSAGASSAVATPLSLLSNNNYESEEGALKIDEDPDAGKENRQQPPGIKNSPAGSHKTKVDDDIVDLETSNGDVESEEEEAIGIDDGDEIEEEEEEMAMPSMPMAQAAAAAAAVAAATMRGKEQT
jgi:hypothetical protein